MSPAATKSKQTCKWHNALPAWIANDATYQKLRQGCRHTLQAIADWCDDPKRFDNGETLLVCFGGDSLIRECGCSTRTYRRHMKVLTKNGFVVCVSGGVGKLASIYGIPGCHGELDAYRAEPGDRRGSGPGGRWTEQDTELMRVQLGCQNTLTARVSDNESTLGCQSAPTEVSDCRPRRDKLSAQTCQNVTLPSPVPSPNHPITNSVDDEDSVQGDEILTDTQRQIKAALERCGVHGTMLSTLTCDPSVTVPRIHRVWKESNGKGSRTGYLVTVLNSPDAGPGQTEYKTTEDWYKAIKDGVVTILPNGVEVAGREAKRGTDGLYLVGTDGERVTVAVACNWRILRWVERVD
jgi:hypothetical protein